MNMLILQSYEVNRGKEVLKIIKSLIILLLITLLCLIYRKKYEISAYFVTGGPMLVNKNKVEISTEAHWLDDYYTIEYIDKRTIAIGEPRYWQQNYSYLIVGDKKALLFDSGPGVRDISKVVKTLTALPVVNMVSHYHFDHIGNINKFEDVYLAENQLINQELSKINTLKPINDTFLGHYEGREAKEFKVTRVVKNGEHIDLGDRTIKVIIAPGHAYNSIVLYDDEAKQLFSGDFIYPGLIGANKWLCPDASLEEYKSSAKTLLEIIAPNCKVYGGHIFKTLIFKDSSAADYTMPIVSYQDIGDLYNILSQEATNQSILPKTKIINKKVKIIY